MERLSGLDASFLYIESSTQPLNICSILELDTSTIPGGYAFDRLRGTLAARLCSIPQFRAKLADNPLNLDRPVWVEDKDFDLSRHVHRIGIPAPGGRKELTEVCGHIAASPLDRGKPLWEMWVLEGFTEAGGPADAGLAVMIKVHHSAVDGVVGATIMSQLCSTEPDAPLPEPVSGLGDAGVLDIVVGGFVGWMSRPLRLFDIVPSTVATAFNTVRRARAGGTMATPFTGPVTPFNAAVTEERNMAYAQLELEDVKTVKNRFGVTVNDVVLALCAGVLRGFLHDRGELPDKPLVAMVPVSVHDKSTRRGRNQVTPMFCRLETHIDDPDDRLQAIARGDSLAKEHSSAIGPTLLLDLAEFTMRPVFALIGRLMANARLSHTPVHNLVISNVPGPQTRLYCLGAELRALYPFGPIFHGSGLNITVMSLNGKLNVGIASCPELVADVWELADNFDLELDRLLGCRAQV